MRDDEARLIEWLFAPLADNAVARGLRDDAACYTPPLGHDLIISTDALAAGVHFFADDPPQIIAARLTAANMSDLAAKGAQPLGCLLVLGLAPDWDNAWLAAFATALARQFDHYGVQLWGGDTIAQKGAGTLSLTVHGSVPQGAMVARNGAQAGDIIFVTGEIGAAFLALEARAAGQGAPHDAYASPRARVDFGCAMRAHASAACDISDGLLRDASQLAAASHVTLDIMAAQVPLAEAARDIKRQVALMSGGDDYEILLTAPPKARAALTQIARDYAVPLTAIGEVTAGGARVHLRDGAHQLIDFGAGGYVHQ